MQDRSPRLIRAIHDGEFKHLLPLSDGHIGAPTCDYQKLQSTVQWALDNDAWVLLLGDLVENANRGSVGSGNYEQTLSPQEQQDFAVELLRPLAERGLILGAVIGNHEWRTANDSGINITKNICDILGVKYLGFSIFVHATVGKQKYIIFGLHGASGGTSLTGKINAVQKLAHHRDADIFLMGHVHDIWVGSDKIMKVDTKSKTVKEHKRHYVLTGAYLDYQGSYGEMKAYPPSKTGTPKIRLDGTRFDPIISI